MDFDTNSWETFWEPGDKCSAKSVASSIVFHQKRKKIQVTQHQPYHLQPIHKAQQPQQKSELQHDPELQIALISVQPVSAELPSNPDEPQQAPQREQQQQEPQQREHHQVIKPEQPIQQQKLSEQPLIQQQQYRLLVFQKQMQQHIILPGFVRIKLQLQAILIPKSVQDSKNQIASIPQQPEHPQPAQQHAELVQPLKEIDCNHLPIEHRDPAKFDSSKPPIRQWQITKQTQQQLIKQTQEQQIEQWQKDSKETQVQHMEQTTRKNPNQCFFLLLLSKLHSGRLLFELFR